MKPTVLIFVAVLSCSLINLHAQTFRDAGLWTTVSVEYEFKNNLTLVLDEEFRLKDNFSSVNLFYTNLGITYEPNRSIRFGLIYRNIQKFRLDGSVSFRNRLMFDVLLKKKYGEWAFSLRTRLQGEVQDYYTSEFGKMAEYYLRNKVEVKYDINRWTPSVSVELRYQIYERKTPETNGLYHRVRPTLGLDYKINKHNSCGVYYLIQNEWNVSERDELFIVGLQYVLKL